MGLRGDRVLKQSGLPKAWGRQDRTPRGRLGSPSPRDCSRWQRERAAHAGAGRSNGATGSIFDEEVRIDLVSYRSFRIRSFCQHSAVGRKGPSAQTCSIRSKRHISYATEGAAVRHTTEICPLTCGCDTGCAGRGNHRAARPLLHGCRFSSWLLSPARRGEPVAAIGANQAFSRNYRYLYR
jgi:hypothetical protein